MKLLDALLGRRRQVRNDLDDLFALPTAAITLQTAMAFEPTGVGAVCFRAAEGSAFAAAEAEIVAVLDNDDDPDIEKQVDQYGFTWLIARQDDMSALVTDLHADAADHVGVEHVGVFSGGRRPDRKDESCEQREGREPAQGSKMPQSQEIPPLVDLPRAAN